MEKILRDLLPGGTFTDVSVVHSRRMQAIRGKGNRTTEARFRAMLVGAGIRGWVMRTKGIKGKPDFFFLERKLAVFVDGCFWHGCPKCGHVPRVNRPFWKAKIERNQRRDIEIDGSLREIGIMPVRFWEHELRDCPKRCLEQLVELVATNPSLM
jgi:DNA mismatch endonuclease (patch repair protein)